MKKAYEAPQFSEEYFFMDTQISASSDADSFEYDNEGEWIS